MSTGYRGMTDTKRDEAELVVKVIYEEGYEPLAAAVCSLFDPRSASLRLDAKVTAFVGDDVLLVVGDSPDTFRSVLSRANTPPTLVLGPTNDTNIMLEVVEIGAIGYLSNGSPLETITNSIRSVARGTAVLPPIMLGALARQSVERERRRQRVKEKLKDLTPRQREVFFEAAKGQDKHGIAEALCISPETARTHVHNVMATLGLHSRHELISLAYELRYEEGDV